MSEPTPRQVLYALVAGALLVAVAVLVVGAALSGLVPGWWTNLSGAGVLLVGVWGAMRWRRTGEVLFAAIGLFLIWAIGTLVVTG